MYSMEPHITATNVQTPHTLCPITTQPSVHLTPQVWQPPQALQHWKQVQQQIQQDDSKYALKPPNDNHYQQVMAELSQALMHVHAIKTTERDKRVWEMYWEPYVARMGTTPWRDDPALAYSYTGRAREGILCALFLVTLMTQIKPRNRCQPTCNPKTPPAYLRAIMRIHQRNGVEMVSTQLVKNAAKGICNMYVRRHGPEIYEPKQKQPLTNQIIMDMINVPAGTRIGKRARVEHGSLLWKSVQAWLAFSAQSGARAAETGSDTNVISHADYTFQNVYYEVQGVKHRCMTQKLQRLLTALDIAVVKVTCSKADPIGDVFMPYPLYLAYRSNTINACRLLADLEVCYPPAEQRKQTAMFRDEKGRPLTTKRLRVIFKWLLRATVPKGERGQYSIHSFKIFILPRASTPPELTTS
jgi:hypothetical protein